MTKGVFLYKKKMKDQEKQMLSSYINSNDRLGILDADGICSFMQFDAIALKESEGRPYFSC